MDDMLDLLMGVDKKNEIFNLYYEVTYLRNLFCHFLQNNSELAVCMDKDAIDKARKEAQEVVRARFPMCDIKFPDPDAKQEDSPCIPPTP